MAAWSNPLARPPAETWSTTPASGRTCWKVAGAGAGIVGAIVARKLLDRVRLRASDHGDVPLNPADERMSWPYALVWAGIVGIGASLGRCSPSARRGQVWQRQRHLPVAAMPT